MYAVCMYESDAFNNMQKLVNAAKKKEKKRNNARCLAYKIKAINSHAATSELKLWFLTDIEIT